MMGQEKFPSPLRGGVRGGGAAPSGVISERQVRRETGRYGADTPIPNPFPAGGKGLSVEPANG